jgi:hypothetical protein
MAVASVPSSGGGLQPYYQKFTSSSTFTLPSGYGASKPLLVNIQVIGGGGGGGGSLYAVGSSGNLFAGWQNYFGNATTQAFAGIGAMITTSTAGGSGGLCATQLYLTSNLTITVGAGGTRGLVAQAAAYNGNTGNNIGGVNPVYYDASGSNSSWVRSGGTGGTTTASVLQATGGAPGVGNYAQIRMDGSDGSYRAWNDTGRNNGAGGTPAGTTGNATPLLGTLAGGSDTSTPIRGSFGVGGISTDGTTSTGADGTGGGYNAVGASGAVILTWWA